MCSLCDRSTFHLGTVSCEKCRNVLFGFFVCDELIAADNSSVKYLNFRINLFTYFLSQIRKCLVRLKREHIHLRNLSLRITKAYCIHIVMNQIAGNNQITDVDLRFQRTGDSCIDHCFYIKHIDQDLCADRRIYLPNTAAYHNNILTFQNALAEFHACFCQLTRNLHLLLQLFYLNFHCSYNSNCTHVCLLLY